MVPERGPLVCADDVESPGYSPMESPRATASRLNLPARPAAPSAPMFIPGRTVSLDGNGAPHAPCTGPPVCLVRR